ncbi:tellurium resistance protein TerX [Deltaproteobacteria bacterium]|nr:tellurium resistance protein TerX [Deltaproteobacteria bacterium]
MAISLKKGQGVSLKKSDYDLSEVTIGLGWDVATGKSGFLGKLLGKKQEEYDLDAIAFLLDPNGKVANLSNNDSQDVIFYNNMRHKSGTIWLTGDNRTGAGEGDDEQIIVKLDQLPTEYQKVLFVVTIYQGRKKNQNFGKIENAFIRAVDKNDKEMCRFDLSGDKTYADYHSMVFAELERQGSEWKFTALGKPYATDSFVDILQGYRR